jgi:hypothetical protein
MTTLVLVQISQNLYVKYISLGPFGDIKISDIKYGIQQS